MERVKKDFILDIATAHSRMAKKWRNRQIRWSELVAKCAETRRTGESIAEYAKMSREEQSNVKDVGGFVGGYLRDGIRKTPNVEWRSCATLDIDHGTPDVWEDFVMSYPFAALLYSTHKHKSDNPRFRLVIPFNRRVQPHEYEAVCRKVASGLGMDLFDDTTYQLPRLFYWPSTSRDGEFVFEVQDGDALDVDGILSQYADYRDTTTWPVSSREGDIVRREIKKAGDPLEKNGIIGAFCRTYPIEAAIEKFLPEVYEPTSMTGRYTYKAGHVAGGLVCYEGKYAYSHNETDPTSRQLCNAFDLCRIHLFGDLDEDSKATDITQMPSYKKMLDMAADDGDVRVQMTKERQQEAARDFDGIDVPDKDNTNWMRHVKYDGKSKKPKATIDNIIYIMEHDPKLKGKFWMNLFSGFAMVSGELPWKRDGEQWSNTDDANLRVYMDTVYDITGRDKIKDALTAVLTEHRKHPIRDYLGGLVWDGKPRLDRLIIDYIGAEDNELNRLMTRKHFTAAVARVFEPGCKYDYCLVITGAEGIGKSTLFNVMGGEWFSDSLYTMEDKAGMEQARSGWIIELPELGSVKRSDVEQVKAYITRREDNYRPAYGSVVECHPRQCVFCGTTNEAYFLKGDTGNRRFWVMAVDAELRKVKDPRAALERCRNQLWAEAVVRYREGEPLFLPPEMERAARERQRDFNDDADDPLEELVRQFVDRKLPVDWDTYDLDRRKAYIKNPDPLDAEATETRQKVCVAEIVCELLGKSRDSKEYKYTARKVGRIMDSFTDWEKVGVSKHATKIYGTQKAYRRIKDENDDTI